jgi:hypothetical protein
MGMMKAYNHEELVSIETFQSDTITASWNGVEWVLSLPSGPIDMNAAYVSIPITVIKKPSNDHWIPTASGIVLFTRENDTPIISRSITYHDYDADEIYYDSDEDDSYEDDRGDDSDGIFTQPEWEYKYDFDFMKRSKQDLHDSLMAELFHPRRIEKWILAGNDVSDYKC